MSEGTTHTLKCGLKWNDRYVIEFLNNTTINGIAYIFKGKSKIRRIAWGLIFIGAVIGCITLIGFSIKQFTNKPTATTIIFQSSEENGSHFPAVTICNVNQLSIKNPANYFLFTLFDPIQAFNPSIPNTSTLLEGCYNHDLGNDTDIVSQEIWEYMTSIEVPDNFIQYCGYSEDLNTKTFRCEKEFVPVLTPSGLCFTLNSIQNNVNRLLIRKIGRNHGLKLILNVDKKNRPGFEGEAGVQVVIHDWKDIARPTLYGIGVPVGKNAIIPMVRHIVVDETSEVGCRDDIELTFLSNVVYSQFACLQDAKIKHIAKTCGCILGPDRPHGGPFVNIRNCTFGDACCMIKEYRTYDAIIDCPVPCSYSYYDHHISYTSYPTESYFEDLAETYNTSVENIKDNYLSIHVFMENIQVINSVTQYTYGITNLLADFGGHSGLFLGISIISILEVIVLLIDELKKICITKKMKVKLDAIDANLQVLDVINIEDVNVEQSAKQVMENGNEYGNIQ